MDGWMDVCMCVSFYSKFTSYSNNVKGAKPRVLHSVSFHFSYRTCFCFCCCCSLL